MESNILLTAPRLPLTERQLYDLEMLMVGGFAPLDGFLNEADYHSVVERMRLAGGALWPIPVVLDVPEDAPYQEGDTIVLTDQFGAPLALFTIESSYTPDKAIEARMVYGTTDDTHPGVRYLFSSTHPRYLGGSIAPLSLPGHEDFVSLRKTPKELREHFREKGYEKVVAFQTRNPVHRAHYELMKHAGETHGAHVLLHPVVGPTKEDDIDYKTRVRSYRRLYDSYMRDFATLSLLPLAMRLAGPREALWHARIRKNYGATHFIVGRDHAGPGNDKTGAPFYGMFDAEALVSSHAQELGMTIIPGREMVYIEELQTYMPRELADETHTVKTISGTQVRKMLREGTEIPEWFSFPETVAELRRGIAREKNIGAVIFFTGLSGAGKSTIARALASRIDEEYGKTVTLLDGDVVRLQLSRGLGFSREERDANVERIGFVAAEIARHGGIAVCSAIAPYEASRRKNRIRTTFANGLYVEVHVSTPLAVCMERDSKGLYQKAQQGLLKHFTGIDDPYESPSSPEIVIDTSTTPLAEAVGMVVAYLEKAGALPPRMV